MKQQLRSIRKSPSASLELGGCPADSLHFTGYVPASPSPPAPLGPLCPAHPSPLLAAPALRLAATAAPPRVISSRWDEITSRYFRKPQNFNGSPVLSTNSLGALLLLVFSPLETFKQGGVPSPVRELQQPNCLLVFWGSWALLKPLQYALGGATHAFCFFFLLLLAVSP